MTTSAITSARYAMTLVGDPKTTNAKSKALANGGPLILAKEHVLAVMLPDAVDFDTHAPNGVIDLTDLQSAAIGGMLLELGAVHLGMHWSVELSRWTMLLKDLDDNGFGFEPIKGDLKTAWPTFALTLTTAIRNLPITSRTIAESDLYFDGDNDDAATGTWFDWITPAMLMGGEGGPEVVAQFTSAKFIRAP